MDALSMKLSQIAVELPTAGNVAKSNVIFPFRQIATRQVSQGVPSGLKELDAIIGNFGFGEYSLITGFSGGGKSLTTMHTAKNAALLGFKSTFLSLEEPAENVTQRLYADVFNISYSDLHKGRVMLMDLEQRLNNLDDVQKQLVQNIAIVGLHDHGAVSYKVMQHELEKLADMGHATDLVIADQLENMVPVHTTKTMSGWEKLETCGKEFNDLTHMKIRDTKPFAGILVHQVNGKLKETFTREDLAGFKGLDKPADNMFGIGRANQMIEEVNLFSLKCRHSKNFAIKYQVDFEHMRYKEKLSFKQYEKPKEEQQAQVNPMLQWTTS